MDVVLPYLFALYPSVLSAAAICWMCTAHRHNWANWIALLLASTSVMLFVYLTSPWAFSSYYLRYVFVALFFAAVTFSYFKMLLGISETEEDNPSTKLVSVVSTVVFAVFIILNGFAVMSRHPSDGIININFPFKSGHYYVLQGGDNFVTNPFHVLAGEGTAIDIVKLNMIGNRAYGISPRDLSDYKIFGQTVYSPCKGVVTAVRDGISDAEPGVPDSKESSGNFIRLKCSIGNLFLGHLQRGSIQVIKGQKVDNGVPLALVGNSGNTLEPHLHISASRDGKPIGISFNGLPLSINTVIVFK